MNKASALVMGMLIPACISMAAPACTLVETWKTAAVLDVPEGALLNPADNLLYESNVSGN